MVWGGMRFLDASHLQELFNELTLKICSLIRMNAFREAVYAEKVTPETICFAD